MFAALSNYCVYILTNVFSFSKKAIVASTYWASWPPDLDSDPHVLLLVCLQPAPQRPVYIYSVPPRTILHSAVASPPDAHQTWRPTSLWPRSFHLQNRWHQKEAEAPTDSPLATWNHAHPADILPLSPFLAHVLVSPLCSVGSAGFFKIWPPTVVFAIADSPLSDYPEIRQFWIRAGKGWEIRSPRSKS